MDWIEAWLDDESIFPQKLLVNIIAFVSAEVASNSDATKELHSLQTSKRLSRQYLNVYFCVYAYMYHNHFQKIASLKEEAHLNTCFKHFILLSRVNCFNMLVTIHFFLSGIHKFLLCLCFI
ncbi:hypothetical protein MLD38_039090 [Melastoma candidum]|uniref:Uncharacterized protein n=1 Tax=Melastoma candidum TaxID=119954 RepID=A0ACB9L208_9MYRT|nr:hypothetical protein MLD38_039090 [Melastoma candidum]